MMKDQIEKAVVDAGATTGSAAPREVDVGEEKKISQVGHSSLYRPTSRRTRERTSREQL